MRKIIFITSALFLSCVFALSVHAVVPPPTGSIWVTPTDPKAGDTITLNAFVYNNTTEEILATVSFTQGQDTQKKGIATITITVPVNTAKVAMTAWNMPEQQTTVTATITKATTKAKVDVPALLGEIGSISVGETTPIILPDLTTAKGWVGTFLTGLEDFRVKQAAHYAEALKASKAAISGIARKDVVTLLSPDNPNAPTPTTEGETLGSIQETKSHAAAYATVVFATAANSFFAHKAAFYISLVILALLVIRFIIKRFV